MVQKLESMLYLLMKRINLKKKMDEWPAHYGLTLLQEHTNIQGEKILYPETTIANLHREYKMDAEKKTESELQRSPTSLINSTKETFLCLSPGKIDVTDVNLSNMET